VEPRRPGDPPVLVAAKRRILASLGRGPERDDLERILAAAWRWERRLRAMRRQIGA
jgi:UDP-glucose 4-epimerase